MPSTAGGSLISAGLLAMLLYSLDPAAPTGRWFCALAAVCALRLVQFAGSRRWGITPDNVHRWRFAFAGANMLAGGVWASTVWVADFTEYRQAVAVIVVLCGIMAAAGVLYAASLRAFFAFVMPIMWTVVYALQHHPELAKLTPLLLAYFLTVASGAFSTAKAVIRSLAVQLDNLELVEELQEERDHIRVLNAELESRVATRTAELSASNQRLLEEIAEKDQAQRRLAYQASHDALTALCNRTEFEYRLRQVVQDRRQGRRPHAVCCMDLDQFKLVNDTCGHGAGDELLRRLSGVIATHVRQGDTLARLGGDEFGILMYDAGLNEAMLLIERLRDMIENFTFLWERRQFKVTASFGVAIITDDYDSVTDVLRDADTACFLAKDRGRNCVHVHVQDDDTVSERRKQMAWINRIDAAMTDGRLLLARQAIVRATGGGARHWEALLRLRDEDGDVILPGQFLPAAERYGMMPRLDRFVVDRVVDYLDNDPEGDDVYGINLSGASLGDDRLLAHVHERVRRCVAPARLCFEITETSAISNLAQVSEIIRELRALGCGFALDDFGTGMASFDYLRSLPVDFLKIDGSFIKDIDENPISHAMVRAVHDIAHLMGMRTIAEYVETEAIATVLRGIGIDYLQGYHYGRPAFFMAGDEEPNERLSRNTVQFLAGAA
ncbi:MAG: putative bifunctional diguanylate cyclase/phosphodiesterase [Gammaproteobacteria bacterium]